MERIEIDIAEYDKLIRKEREFGRYQKMYRKYLRNFEHLMEVSSVELESFMGYSRTTYWRLRRDEMLEPVKSEGRLLFFTVEQIRSLLERNLLPKATHEQLDDLIYNHIVMSNER